jgi:purine-binding chemotaxis protein CheW
MSYIEASEMTSALENSQFLTFSLAGEEYGVDILKIQEIKGYVPTTRIPNSPPEIVGVLNLRGTIVPVMDLRKKFGLEAVQYDSFTAIVVAAVRNRVIGMIVDQVSEVVTIPTKDIQPPPIESVGVDHSLEGLARVGDKLIILLDVEAVLLSDVTEFELAA